MVVKEAVHQALQCPYYTIELAFRPRVLPSLLGFIACFSNKKTALGERLFRAS